MSVCSAPLHAVAPANPHVGMAVGYVVFGSTLFRLSHRVMWIRARMWWWASLWANRRCLFGGTVETPWVANHHPGARLGADGLERGVPWHRESLVSGGSAVFLGTCSSPLESVTLNFLFRLPFSISSSVSLFIAIVAICRHTSMGLS